MHYFSRRYFVFAMSALYVFALWMHATLYINSDVSWLLNSTQRLLGGGTYAQDFFEINAPMIFYLYIPPVMIAHYFHLPTYYVLPGYIFILATLSLALSYSFIKKIFSFNLRDAYLFTFAVGMILLILPLYEFGQREHLLVILTFPYFFSVVYRLQGHALKPAFAISIGLLAGLGFAIKPFFIIPLILVEMYYIFFNRQLRSCLRPETISILAIFFLYAAMLFVFHRDYLSIIAPFALRIYDTVYGVTFRKALSCDTLGFCGFVILLYGAFYKNNHYKVLATVLLWMLIGFSLSYTLGHNILYYHILPAFSVALLMLSLFLMLTLSVNLFIGQYLFLGCIGCLCLAFLDFFEDSNIRVLLILRPWVFYSFFTMLFGFLLYVSQKNKNIFSAASFAIFVVLTGYMISYMAQRSIWYPYQLFLTLLIMFMCISVYFLNSKQYRYIFISLFAMSLFAYPFCIATTLYGRSFVYRNKMEKLVTYLHDNALQRSIFFFTIRTDLEYPASDYAHALSISRFASLGWLCDLNNLTSSTTQATSSFDLTKKKDFFVNITVDDFNRYKPYLVFVDVLKSNLYFKMKQFPFLNFYLRYPKFQAVWKHYRYVTTIQNEPLYELQVYQRK